MGFFLYQCPHTNEEIASMYLHGGKTYGVSDHCSSTFFTCADEVARDDRETVKYWIDLLLHQLTLCSVKKTVWSERHLSPDLKSVFSLLFSAVTVNKERLVLEMIPFISHKISYASSNYSPPNSNCARCCRWYKDTRRGHKYK